MNTRTGRIGRFFRWLFRMERRLDPILERQLEKNREALERQRQELVEEETTLRLPDP